MLQYEKHFQSIHQQLNYLVVPGSSDTIAAGRFAIKFNKDDFPEYYLKYLHRQIR